MAKMSRSALRSLVKECIVEVLQEGLGFDDLMAESVARPRREHRQSMGMPATARPSKRRKHPVLDAPAIRHDPPPSMGDRVPRAIASVSSDPGLQALLEDTAQTTMLNQDRAENSRTSQAQSDVPLEALGLMGAKTSTWETLAFTNLPDSGRIKLE